MGAFAWFYDSIMLLLMLFGTESCDGVERVIRRFVCETRPRFAGRVYLTSGTENIERKQTPFSIRVL